MKHRLTILAILFGIFAAQASAQTIAEAARRERQRQARLQSTMVITNESGRMPAAVAPAQPAAEPASTPAADAPPPAAAAAEAKPITDNQGRDEKYWRTAFEEARAELNRAEQRAALIQLRINQLNADLMMNAALYNRENRLGPELNAARAQLEAAKSEVESIGRRIADMEEELRRSGGLPGWAR